jgi:hypothetical protein
MALVTGTPLGNLIQQDTIYLDSAPPIFFQDSDDGSGVGTVGLLNTPDANGFYWGLSGTVNNPVYQLGCIEGIQLSANIDQTNIRCDTSGDQGMIQKVSALSLTATVKTLLPFTTLRHIIRGGAVTTVSGQTEQFGIGQVNNQKYYYLWLPSVYDPDNGDYFAITGFKCQFTESWAIDFAYGAPSTVGINLMMFADETKPSDQLYASLIRRDPSAIS